MAFPVPIASSCSYETKLQEFRYILPIYYCCELTVETGHLTLDNSGDEIWNAHLVYCPLRFLYCSSEDFRHDAKMILDISRQQKMPPTNWSTWLYFFWKPLMRSSAFHLIWTYWLWSPTFDVHVKFSLQHSISIDSNQIIKNRLYIGVPQLNCHFLQFPNETKEIFRV